MFYLCQFPISDIFSLQYIGGSICHTFKGASIISCNFYNSNIIHIYFDRPTHCAFGYRRHINAHTLKDFLNTIACLISAFNVSVNLFFSILQFEQPAIITHEN